MEDSDFVLDSFRKSKWPMFDRSFAKRIKEDHPEIWAKGGNIKGNDQYEILTKIADQGGVAKTDAQIAALKLREAWIARHKQDFRLPGVIAQIKWLAIGDQGEKKMKEVVDEEIISHSLFSDLTPNEIGEYLEHQGFSDDDIDNFLEHFGVKGMLWGQRREKNLTQKLAYKTMRSNAKANKKAYSKSSRDLRRAKKAYKFQKEMGLESASSNYKTTKTKINQKLAKDLIKTDAKTVRAGNEHIKRMERRGNVFNVSVAAFSGVTMLALAAQSKGVLG